MLAELAARADVLFAGEDEAGLLLPPARARRPAGLTGARRARPAPRRAQARIARGARRLDGAVSTSRPLAGLAVDPVGAGDAFVGGYLAELLAGADLEARLRTRPRPAAPSR